MIKSIINVLFSKVIVLFFSMIILLVQARFLGASDRGILAAILIVPSILSAVFESGMRQSATYYIGKGDISSSTVIYNQRAFSILSSFIALIACFTLQIILNGNYSLDLILISCLVLPLTISINTQQGVLVGLGEINTYAKTLWFPKLIQFIFIVIIVYFGFFNITTSIISFIILNVMTFILITYYVNNHVKINKKEKFDSSVIKVMLKTGVSYSFAFIFVVLNYKIGVFVSSRVLESHELGSYVVGSQLVELLWLLPSSVSVATFSDSARKKDIDDVWLKKILKIILIQSGVIVFCGLLGSLILYYFSNLFFGDTYLNLHTVVLILLPGVVMMSIFKVINVIYAGQGYPRKSLSFMPIIVVLNFILSYYLGKFYGIEGVSLGGSLSYTLAGLIYILFFVKDYIYGVKING